MRNMKCEGRGRKYVTACNVHLVISAIPASGRRRCRSRRGGHRVQRGARANGCAREARRGDERHRRERG